MTGGPGGGMGGIPFGGMGQPSPSQQAVWLKQQQAMHMQMMQNAQNQLGGSAIWTGAQSVFNTTASVFGGPAAPSQPNWLKPDPKQPDTLGWREWKWDDGRKMLLSPSQGTPWPEAELVVPKWDDGEAVRGVSGVHAHLVPRHWKILGDQHTEYASGPERVHGIIERFGKYVLGTEGWRAEWVIIRELMAPSTEIGLKLEQAYPDVIIHYPDEEEDLSCISVKLSKSGKGSRHTPRQRSHPLQNSSQQLSPSQLQNSSQASPRQIQILASQSSALIGSLNSSPLSLSLGANQQSPSGSESSKRKSKQWMLDVCWWAFGLALFYCLNQVLS